jgi:hypothetical protein
MKTGSSTCSNMSHVMLSYSHNAYKLVVIAFQNELRKLGYDVWRDETGSSILDEVNGGPIEDHLKRAVDLASWVIVFVSEHYVASNNCLFELKRARSKEKKVCFVRFSPEFDPFTPLGKLIASDQFLYCIPDVASAEDGARRIVRYIKNR